jgi:hypothetical protein
MPQKKKKSFVVNGVVLVLIAVVVAVVAVVANQSMDLDGDRVIIVGE